MLQIKVKDIFLIPVYLFSILMGSAVMAQAKPPRVVADNPVAFPVWLAEFKQEALGQGISESTLEQAFSGINPDPKVIKLDRHQPEFTQTYAQYISKRLSETRIRRGREKLSEEAALFKQVSNEIGVQPRFIASIWGMETNYGSFTGGYNVIQSLTTLAYDMRRPTYFRRELLKALQILDEGHISPEEMKGSWAGAMGHGQFMPSSFFGYAYDFDRDAKKDIWTNKGDVFASIGNYLKKHGWRGDRTWGREVKLPEDVDGLWQKVKNNKKIKSCRRSLRHHSKQMSLSEWQALGVRTKYGADLPNVGERDFMASLVMPDGRDGPAYLTYRNFRALLSYNCSNSYALGVSLLSDQLQ